MEIKSLPQEVRSQLRNGTNINNVTQCVTELVLNSLDAKSTAVAVRVNLLTFQIQVVDNGSGITKSNMIPIGNRFMTSKCRSLTDLKNIRYSGFRGEALTSIRGISKTLSIASRPEDVENTYCKVCKNGKWGEVECIKQRPSKGTTVTVEGFMNNLPVRQKRINQSVDMENIKKMLESLAIIHSKVSFNLRNDANGKTILKSSKTLSVSQALVNFYPHISIENLVQVQVSRDKITISGLIYKSPFNSNKLQFLYLNKRVIISAKIQKLVNSLLSKVIVQESKTQKTAKNYLHADKNAGNKYEYPVYVLNIRCPYSEVDLTLCPTKKNVEFKNWDTILACFKKAINSLAQDEKLIDLNHSKKMTSKMEKLPLLEGCKSQFGISQVGGVIKSVPIRRNKIEKKPSESSLKIAKEDRFSDSSNIQMLNPGAKSHCDDTIEKLLLSCDENEEKIGSNSKAGDKRKMKKMGSDNETKKFKVDENLNDSFRAWISKSNEKKPKISKTHNNEIKDFPAVIPLKKVAEQVGVKSSNSVANNCEGLSFNSTSFNCFPIFERNGKSNSKNLIDNSVSAKEQRYESKNIEREFNKPASERKSDCKSTNNQDIMENEVEGKKFIMDMFIKSTAMFLNDEELSVSQNDVVSNEKEVEVVGKIVDSGKSKEKEAIGKLKEAPAEEVFPKICLGELNVNDLKMPQFGSMDCFRQPVVYENNNVFSEEIYKPVCLKNYGIDENIFENKKYRTKSICYTKSVYKTTMPEAVLNLDTYQQLMQPKSNAYRFLNTDKKMFSNFENNFTNNNRNSLVPLYQSYHHKSHVPKIKQNIFEQNQVSYNFTSRKIKSFGIKFCKNIDRKLNSQFENHDYAFKSVQAVELHKSVARPSTFNIPSKPKNFVTNEVYNDNFHCERKKLYESLFQLSIPDLPIKNRDHIFKKPCDVPFPTKQIRKFKKPLPVPGMEVGCSSPYFGKRTEKVKTNFFSKDQENVFHFKENRSNNGQKVVDKNVCSPFFQKNEYRVCQNDQMNKSKYFKKKKMSPLLDDNRKPNFFNQHQETGQNANFVRHFKNMETFSNLPVSVVDKQRHLKPVYLRNTEIVDDLFPETKSIERKKFIECPQKKPQFSKLSLKKLKSNSPAFFTNPPTMDFQEKSIYFQKKSFPKSFNDSNDKFELPSKNKNLKNINITFKSDGKMIYQENEDDESTKKLINSTDGFTHFQPKLSSTVIDQNEERVNVEDEEGNNPNNFIVPITEKKKIRNYEVAEVDNQRPSSDKNMDDCEEREPSVLNISIESIRKFLTPADDARSNKVENEEPRKICNILNASILELKRALLNSFEMTNETQKNCSILNNSIADLKSIFSEINKKKKSNLEIEKLNEEWMQHVDEFGKVTYLNQRTGMTSLIKPCDNSSNFLLAPRIDFVPKGFSPILKQSKDIDFKSLSPKSKTALNTEILKSYDDELNTIKWENLIGEFTDGKQFFDNLYREKTKQFDRLIPNASVSTLPRGIVKICNNLEAESITKDIFDDLTIIGQWDNKFIISLVKEKGMLVLFDQHAVDERIRLEHLLEEFMEANQEVHKFKSTKCSVPVVFELSDTEKNILLNYQHLFEDLGLIYKICTNNIYILYMPTCIYNRILKNPKKYQEIELKKFVCSLVSEEINTILSTRGIGIKIPLLMQNILNSEACRGAIKFGDKLNLNECADLIQKLSKCKLPFQCAHGRPTITPILNLQQNVHNKQARINLKNFK